MSLGSIKMSFLWKDKGFPLTESSDESSLFIQKVEIVQTWKYWRKQCFQKVVISLDLYQ